VAEEREQFEKWITAPPFEKNVDKWPSGAAWPGCYKSYEVHLAWDAWQTSRLRAAELKLRQATRTSD